jgi:hypothetical protein
MPDRYLPAGVPVTFGAARYGLPVSERCEARITLTPLDDGGIEVEVVLTNDGRVVARSSCSTREGSRQVEVAG